MGWMIKVIHDPDSGEFIRYQLCESCSGLGTIDLGDCEDGIINTCPECNGKGEIELDY